MNNTKRVIAVGHCEKSGGPVLDAVALDKFAELNEKSEAVESDTLERQARALGWIAEREYNGENDGVRHPGRGDWAEDWQGAWAQEQERKVTPTKGE